tara:strand:+ start:943 stop:1200 length:258 start_codon:yes stop_codon:yes gene_type:complete
MCGGGGYRPPPPPPPSPMEKTLRQQRREARQDELKDKAKLKDEQYQQSVATLTGKRGRRSLLSGRKGGQGFMVSGDIQTRDTLGV